jgi:hypothetical protein
MKHYRQNRFLLENSRATHKLRTAMLASARPNVPKLNAKIEYCIHSVRREHNRTLEYTINFLSLISNSTGLTLPERSEVEC